MSADNFAGSGVSWMLARAQGTARRPSQMRRLLPILAAAGPARAARRAAPCRMRPDAGSPPRTGSRRARWSSSSRASARAGRAAPRRARRARGGGGAARATRGSTTPRPTTSPPPRRPPRPIRRSPTTRAPSTAPAEAAAGAGDWALKQWNFLPWEAANRARCRPRPAASTRSAPGTTSKQPAAPGRRRRHRRRARHRHRLPRPRHRFRRSPDFAAGQFVKGHDFVDDDRLPLDENGHGTHVAGTIAEKTDNGDRADRARLPGEADAGAGARQARPRPGRRHRQGHPLRRRPRRPGDQHELQLRLRQEGAGGRRSAARGLRARRRHGRLGRQPRLRGLRLGAGDRPAGDRRRRHHRGRLPRQLLAGRQRSRPARARAAACRSPAAPRSRPGRSTR